MMSLSLSPFTIHTVFVVVNSNGPNSLKGNGKGNFHPRTGHEGPEGEYGYSSTLSLTSALDRVGGQSHAPAALPPGKIWYRLYRMLGGARVGPDRCGKISSPSGFDPRTVQPVARCCTD